MNVLKFGGSSVGSVERIEQVVKIIMDSFGKGETGVVVFSAFQGVTDKLIETGKLAATGNENYLQLYRELHDRHIATARALLSIQRQSNILAKLKYQLQELEEILHGVFLIRELSAKSLDFIMSFGERLSAYTISQCLKDRGFDNNFLDTRKILKTDDHFGRARVKFSITNKNIENYFADRRVLQIATGFIASSLNEETTTLGRGGSDFSASIFGAALNAGEIEIWTDVDGVLTAAPNKVDNAFSIPQMSYEEAMEMSHFGAKVIYPPTMQPALDKKIPLRIKNTLNPSFAGTVISDRKIENRSLITGISSIDDIALLTIQGSGMIGVAGIAERIFSALARKKINVIMITQASSEHSICLAILPQNKDEAQQALHEELKYEIRDEIISEIRVENGFSILAVVGETMRQRRGLAGRVFQALGDHGINISAIAQGSSELNISIVVSGMDENKALNVIHRAFFEPYRKTVNLFLLGHGLIGKTFLSILKSRIDEIEQQQQISLRLCGIANSRFMMLDEAGIDPQNWDAIGESDGTQTSIPKIVRFFDQIDGKNNILIDCTASESVSAGYADILASGIALVTANKKANSGDISFYRKIRENASENKVPFLYETNVGAGLPVIETINSLISSGDKIVKIEGILSGTLSYIFNSFNSDQNFSEVVREARDKGFTEPDPRDDLNGMDVARKTLILAREIGLNLELDDIRLESLVPQAALDAESVDAFFSELEKYNGQMQKKAGQAAEKNQKLRYIASIENGQADVRLQLVGASHPFYEMQGSDNIIAVYSTNYKTALVIKGPGAGAEVTAAGVFADVLKAANRL